MSHEWTACIPVRNEERTLARTVTSIRNQTAVNSLVSILIGANGCTDKTGEIARQLASQDSRIQVIESPIPGKARMWNTLFNQAPTNNVLFTDGDVVLHEKAAENLVDALSTDKEMSAIAGTVMPYVRDLPLRLRLLNRSYIPTKIVAKPWIDGKIYILDSAKTQSALKTKGFQNMPNQVLAEDSWLTKVLYPDWKSISHAQVFCRPPSLTEEVRMAERNYLFGQQIDGYFGAERINGKPTKSAIIESILAERPTPLSFLTFLFCHTFSKALTKIFPIKELYKREKGYWYQSQYSKIPLPDGLEFSKLN